MGDVISSVEQITTGWLTDVLRRESALPAGRAVTVTPRPLPGRKADIAVPLEVGYTADAPENAPRRLFWKTTSRGSEVWFHRQIAPGMGDSTPALRCYDAEFDGRQGHLLLDDVSETHYVTPEVVSPTEAETRLMLDTLARLHAAWWEHPRLKGDIGSATAWQDPDSYILGRTRETFPAFVDWMGDRLSPKRRRIYETVLANWPPASWTERLAARRGVTLNHGDAHAQNFLLPRPNAAASVKVRGIDWADWRIQTGPNDAAFLIALEFYPERRARFERSLVGHYYDRLTAYGVGGYSWDQCWLDYRAAVIRHALMPVFWQSWSPPEIWWPAFEKVMSAFHDLGCEELL